MVLLPYAKIIDRTEKKIAKIMSNANLNVNQEKIKALSQVETGFVNLGWENWTHEQHIAEGQYDRFVRASNKKKMKLLSFDTKTGEGIVSSSSTYQVSKSSCTCSDFAMRKLPCKHIYFLMLSLSEGISIDNDDF